MFSELTEHLNKAGINTALDLAEINPQGIRRKFSVVLERTVRELRGERCLDIDDDISSKKQIVVSRSFGQRISNLKELRPIVSNFAVRAAEKLFCCSHSKIAYYWSQLLQVRDSLSKTSAYNNLFL